MAITLHSRLDPPSARCPGAGVGRRRRGGAAAAAPAATTSCWSPWPGTPRVLIFIVLVLRATWHYDETQMTQQGPAPRAELAAGGLHGRSAPRCSGSTRSCSWSRPRAIPPRQGAACWRVALLTTALSWGLVHLLFALEYAKLYYVDHPGGPGGAPAGRARIPGRRTCPNTPISSTSRSSSASPARPADVDISSRHDAPDVAAARA